MWSSASGASGLKGVRILRNGQPIAAHQFGYSAFQRGQVMQIQCNTKFSAAAGDYIEMGQYHEAATYLTYNNPGASGYLYPAQLAVHLAGGQGDSGISGFSGLSPSSSAPATAGAAGTPGQTAYDSDWFYVCIATNTWKRTSLTTW
jgi:hypothetical protein